MYFFRNLFDGKYLRVRTDPFRERSVVETHHANRIQFYHTFSQRNEIQH